MANWKPGDIDLRDKLLTRFTPHGWPGSNRNGGRDHVGTLAAIKSESVAALDRNPHETTRKGDFAQILAEEINAGEAFVVPAYLKRAIDALVE